MPDSLEASLNREVIFAMAAPGGGKSYAIAHMARLGLELGFNMVVIDRDRGLAKAIKEVCGKIPSNLDYFLANKFEKYAEGITHAHVNLDTDDWLVFDMIGGMWDMAQSEYSRMVYGDDVTKHLIALRAEAEEALDSAKRTKDDGKVRQAAVQYNGMEGRTDWPLIKRMHNDDLIDDAILNGDFNILSTTSGTVIDEQSVGKWPRWDHIGLRPEGEKHNQHRHDTLMYLNLDRGKYFWRTNLGQGEGKDRGDRMLMGPVECTDEGAISSYFEVHELEWKHD